MSVSPKMRFAILTRDHFTCRYCGRAAPTVVLHVDHVHPVSRGGTDDESNLATACKDCNSSKSAKLLPPRAVAPELAKPRTLPHADCCTACGDRRRLYAALIETPRKAGHVAFYRCANGHEWTTYWSTALRLTQSALSELTQGVT